jgi:hypothetical protein
LNIPQPRGDLFASFTAKSSDAPVKIAPGIFAVEQKLLHKAFDQKKANDRAIRKKLIHPRNCQEIIKALPTEEGDRLHAIVGG